MPLWRLIRRTGSSLHAGIEGNDIAAGCVVALGDGVTDLEFKLRDRVAHPALTKLGTGETKVHYAYDRPFTRHIATWLGGSESNWSAVWRLRTIQYRLLLGFRDVVQRTCFAPTHVSDGSTWALCQSLAFEVQI